MEKRGGSVGSGLPKGEVNHEPTSTERRSQVSLCLPPPSVKNSTMGHMARLMLYRGGRRERDGGKVGGCRVGAVATACINDDIMLAWSCSYCMH